MSILLKLHQKADLVKLGQVLSYFGDELVDIYGSKVDNGFYVVGEVSIKRSYNKIDVSSPHLYTVALNQIVWENDSWRATPVKYSIELRKEGLNECFGVRYQGVVSAEIYITEFIKDQFKKAGRIEDFDDSIDYDRVLGGMAGKLIRRNPFNINKDDQIDMIHDALLNVINQKTVKNYDASRSIVAYFGGMFQKRMIDQLRRYTTRKVKEKELQDKEDFTKDEQMEYLKNKDQRREETPEEVVEFRDLEKNLLKYLMKQRDGDYQRKLWVGLQKGMSSKDIAKKLGVSGAFISKKLKNLQRYVMEFAQKTNNNLLADLMKQMGRKRSNEVIESKEDEVETLFNIFQEYKKRVGSFRDSVGETSRVLKKVFPDCEGYDHIVSRILDSSITTKEMQAELEGFFDEIIDMDDLVEEDDQLTGFKIMETFKGGKGKSSVFHGMDFVTIL